MILFNILCGIILWNLISSIFYLKTNQQTNRLYCGLIGFSGKTPFDLKVIKTIMLWNSFERGEDATGIYSPKNQIIKKAKHCKDFILDTPIEEDKLLIAHVRAKTIGLNVDKNAHPFMENNVVLAHNGTLKNHYALLRKYDLPNAQYDVDSHVMCGIMGKQNNFKVLSEIEGAAAVLIHNVETPDILYAYRNSERPLFKGYIDGNMYISSIKEPLEFAGCKNIKEFKENFLYTIKDGLIVGAPLRIASKPYKPETVNNYNSTNVAVSSMYNMLIRCNTYNPIYMNKPIKVTYDKEYRIIGFDVSNNTLQFVDDACETVSGHRYIFDIAGQYFTVGDYVKSRHSLREKGGTGDVAIKKEGVLYVSKDLMNGNIEVLNLDNNEYYVLPKYFVKKLTAAEKLLFTSPQEEDDSNYKFPFKNSNFINESTEKLNEAEEEDDDIDEDTPEDDYYDLSVNEQELTDNFIKIDDIFSKLVKIADTVVNENNTSYGDTLEYESLKQQMETQLLHCADLYMVTSTK